MSGHRADSADDAEDPTEGLEFAALPLGGILGASLTLSTAAGQIPSWLGTLTAGLASPAAVIAAQAIVNKQSRQIQSAVDEACDYGECTFDEIIASSVGSARKIELLSDALQGAARSEDDLHVKALGRLLVTGAFAPPGPDGEHARIMAALARLDSSDIELLDYMGRRSGDGGGAFFVGSLAESKGGTLTTELPHLAQVVDSLVARLSTFGIISAEVSGMTFASPFWRLTPFGRMCVGWLLVEGTS